MQANCIFAPNIYALKILLHRYFHSSLSFISLIKNDIRALFLIRTLFFWLFDAQTLDTPKPEREEKTESKIKEESFPATDETALSGIDHIA